LQEVHEMPSHNMKAIFYFVRLQIHKDTWKSNTIFWSPVWLQKDTPFSSKTVHK
jgi:hypothetical protein